MRNENTPAVIMRIVSAPFRLAGRLLTAVGRLLTGRGT
jgi:hypothetical protein